MSASLSAIAALATTAPPTAAYPSDDAYPGNIDELLTRLLRNYEEAEDATRGARLRSERARDFRDGKQWTAEEAETLRRRKQPVVWNNVIGRKIDLLRGIERRGRSDPKAYPRTPDQENRADCATQVLRYISDDQRFDVIRSAVHDNMLVEGFGGCEVIVELDTTLQSAFLNSTALTPVAPPSYNVVINQIPWERLFYDPHSQHAGFQDARYLGQVIWQDRDQVLDRWPDAGDILDASFAATGINTDTYGDKPRSVGWTDNRRTRVRIIEIHWQRGKDWWMATACRGGFLDQPRKSPYADRHGNAACPIIMRSARIDRDNNRFGIVHDMVPLQEEINKRHSKLLHSLSVNQIHMEQGAVQDVDDARREVAKPDGVVVTNPGMKFEVHKDQAEIQGQFELLQFTIGQMNVAGPNAAMSGKDPREQSGRAILAQQSGGQLENEPITDELRQFTHKVFEAVWMRARQFWTAEKAIRVTASNKNVEFLALNHPVTLAEELAKIEPDQQANVMRQMALVPNDPRLQQVMRVENQIDDLDVDITVEEGPDTPSLEIDQWQSFTQLPPQILQQFPIELFIKMNPGLRDKDQFLALIEAHKKEQAAAQQAQQAAQQAMQQAQVAKVQADAQDRAAQAGDRHAQTIERMHGMAMDHAAAMTTPAFPQLGRPAQPAPLGA